MALNARNAASLAVLVASLASPLTVAAQSRAGEGRPTSPHTAQRRVRPQPSARAARGDGRADEGSQVAGDPNAVVRWEDQDGTVHYTRAYEVPQRLRTKARRVHATVGTVPLDRAEKGESAASAEGAISTADLPMKRLPPGPALSPGPGTPQGSPSGASQEPTTSPEPTSGADAGR